MKTFYILEYCPVSVQSDELLEDLCRTVKDTHRTPDWHRAPPVSLRDTTLARYDRVVTNSVTLPKDFTPNPRVRGPFVRFVDHCYMYTTPGVPPSLHTVPAPDETS